jgi:hypothetical protein
MAHLQDMDGEEGLHIYRIAGNILNKQSHAADSGWSSSLELGWVLTIPYHKGQHITICYIGP